MRSLFGSTASGHVEAAAAFAFDAVSNATGVASGPSSPMTWTHTPAGIPKGIVVLIAQENSGLGDNVTAVTYGGTSMSAMSGSALNATLGAEEDCSLYGYFLGSSIPTGAQTVSVTFLGGVSSTNGAAYSVVGPNNSTAEDTSTTDHAAGTDPTVALTIANESFVCGVLMSGRNDLSDLTVASGYTSVLGVDVGSQSVSFAYKTALISTNSAMSWTCPTSAVYAIFAAAIKST